MKIAVPSTLPDLSGHVAHKPGAAPFLLIIDTEDMSFEAVPGISTASGQGAGIMIIAPALEQGAQAVLTGYIAPHIASVLQKQGIDVVTDVSGPVNQAVAAFMKERLNTPKTSENPEQETVPEQAALWKDAAVRALRQLQTLLPRMVGVILLLGLFRGFVSEQMLLSLFSGSALTDTVLGAALGSVMAGNPVNSYVIGEGLLNAGVGLAGVTALMLAWVNVGVIQLPAEAAALGRRFALVRNGAGFVVAVLLSLILKWCIGGVS